MKRARGLYEKYLTRENAKLALLEVNRTHRWTAGHRPNRTVRRIKANVEGAVDALLVIAADYRPNAPRMRRRWDESAGKCRDIYEPDLWPDQYVHHMAIQTLQPVLMRGMDGDCCGRIPGRGIHYGMKRLRSRDLDLKGTWQVFPTKAREVAALGYRFAPVAASGCGNGTGCGSCVSCGGTGSGRSSM